MYVTYPSPSVPSSTPLITRPPPRSTPFPYTTLFRSPEKLAHTYAYLSLGGMPSPNHYSISVRVTNRNGDVGSASFSGDRKSTRLNSSHTVISYAVFCLKKKNIYN